MTVPVGLPRTQWGSASSPRHALLVHGLGSNGALMWRFGTALAAAGWSATAVDLRGHGAAPRALDYTRAAYVADLAAVRPAEGGWDLVVGHSLGGGLVTAAASALPGWAARVILIDPGILLDDRVRAWVRSTEATALGAATAGDVRRENPHWHENDVELEALANSQMSAWAVAETDRQNPEWDLRAAALALRVPTHVIAGDPAVLSIFAGTPAEDVCANPAVTMSVVPGAGHSPHRDDPDETLRQFSDALTRMVSQDLASVPPAGQPSAASQA